MLSRFSVFGWSLRSFFKQLRHFSSDNRHPLSVTRKSTSRTKEAVVNNVEHKDCKVEPKEREINLLSPCDLRAPLPGNTGFSLKRYTDIILLSKIANATTVQESNLIKDHRNERIYDFINQFLKESNIADKDLDPLLVASDYMECKIYRCPDLIKEDFKSLFPHRDLGPTSSFSVMVIAHKTEADMASWSEEGDLEREELTSLFLEAAQEMCTVLSEYGFWAEYIDPRSGIVCGAYLDKPTPATFFETDERYRHFGFEIEDLGCCKVISHHLWGTKMFVGSIFTNAPPESEVMVHLATKYAKLFPSSPLETK